VALCVDYSAALNKWDSSSPLITVSISFCFSFRLNLTVNNNCQ
jgi:hypothetical protein